MSTMVVFFSLLPSFTDLVMLLLFNYFYSIIKITAKKDVP